jgi:uncharacterized protein
MSALRIAEVWRYPVKSLLGERLSSARIDVGGIHGDRRFALFDVETGFGLTARRVPELLFASARLVDGGRLEIALPDGSVAGEGDDDALSDWLGRRVQLRSADTTWERRYENPADFEHEETSRWDPFEGASGAFHDSRRTRVSLVSRATVGDWDPRRFRANVLLDGAGEDALVGSRVQLGEAVLDVTKQIERCVMVTRAQAGGVERDLDVLRTIARERATLLAVGALVAEPGGVRVGDTVSRWTSP